MFCSRKPGVCRRALFRRFPVVPVRVLPRVAAASEVVAGSGPVTAEAQTRHDELVAQGDKRITVFHATSTGPFRAAPFGALEPVLNTAVGVDDAGRAVVYIPGRPQSRILSLR